MTEVDTLIKHAYVVTVNAGGEEYADGAVAVSGNAIVAVGATSELEKHFAAADVIDASGHMVTPGFINVHSHAVLTVLRGVSEDQGATSLYNLLFPLKLLWNDERLYAMGMCGVLENMMLGTTTLMDNYNRAMAIAPAAAASGIRCVIAENIMDADTSRIRDGDWCYDDAIGDVAYDNAVQLIEQWHGAADGRVTCMVGALAADLCSPKALTRVRELAEEHSLMVTYHCCQTLHELKQIRDLYNMTPVEYMSEHGLVGPHVLAAHCVYVAPSDIELLGSTKSNLAHNPAINAKRGKSAPLSELREAGMNVGIGTDNMHGNIVEAMKMAVHIGRVRTGEGTFLQAREVMRMATADAARAIGREGDLGSLEVGKLADLLVIDLRQPHLFPITDPVVSFIHNGLGTDVRHVMIDGRFTVRDRQPLFVDRDAVLGNAQAHADAIWSELPGVLNRGG